MSVFVAVGNAEQPFDRLVEHLDRCVGQGILPADTFVQMGSGEYEPHHASFCRYMDGAAFAQCIDDAQVIVTAAGVGTILQCLRAGKRPVVFPRRACFGEVVDDHQLEICEEFERRGYVFWAREVGEIVPLIQQALGADRAPALSPSRLPAMVRDWVCEMARRRRWRG